MFARAGLTGRQHNIRREQSLAKFDHRASTETIVFENAVTK